MAQRHKKTATVKQITALKLINEIDPETGKPYSKRKAMLQAGYSQKMANNPDRLMKSQAIRTVVERFQLELKDVGITTAYLASKYAEWLDASQPLVTMAGVVKDEAGKVVTKPLYQVQLEAGKMLRDVMNIVPQKEKMPEGATGKMTLEKFVFGETENNEAP